MEHGLYNSWVNLASMLTFRWNTGMKHNEFDLQQIITLDKKFVSLIYIILITHAFSIVVFAAECVYYRKLSWRTGTITFFRT